MWKVQLRVSILSLTCSLSILSPQSHPSEFNSSVVQSETPSVILEGLRPGTGYVVQVRARTVAGYGAYSKEMLFQTLTDGKCVGALRECCGGVWRSGSCMHNQAI